MGTHPIFESDFDCLTEKMETLNNVKTRLQFRPGDNDKEGIKYDREKVKERYLEQRKNLEILHYVLGKKPTESLTDLQEENKLCADEIAMIEQSIGKITIEDFRNLIKFSEEEKSLSTIDKSLKISLEKLERIRKELEEHESIKDDFSDEDFKSAIKRTKNAIDEKMNQKILLEQELEKITLAKQLAVDRKNHSKNVNGEKVSKLLLSLKK